MQGSHIVVRKLYDHGRCYFFQNPDGRIFFAIPYEEDFTLIGTTDQDYSGDLDKVRASEAEIAYLIAAANSYFKRRSPAPDVVWSYSGVRPLYDDGASAAKDATRDYVLTLDGERPALVNVFGGKITTYRRLAEDVWTKLGAALPQAARNAGWTARAKLPGGDFPIDGAEALAADLAREYPFLDARAGAPLRAPLRHADAPAARPTRGGATISGAAFGGDLTEAEVAYLMDREFARTAEDVVWRRTKSGLRMGADDIAALDQWMAARSKTKAAATA